MIFYDLSFSSPLENIACDDFLLQQVQQGEGPDILRLWESPAVFVVLGLGRSVEEDVKKDICRRENIDILRRTSGGGTVLQGKGCLNFSLIYSKQRHLELQDLHHSYQAILNPVMGMLEQLGVNAQFCPTSDLALVDNQRKFSGNAQRRSREAILHHGTILYNYDLSLIERYLHMPNSIPVYRNGRSHDDFVANLELTSDQIRHGFLTAFPVKKTITTLTADEFKALTELLNNNISRYRI